MGGLEWFGGGGSWAPLFLRLFNEWKLEEVKNFFCKDCNGKELIMWRIGWCRQGQKMEFIVKRLYNAMVCAYKKKMLWFVMGMWLFLIR